MVSKTNRSHKQNKLQPSPRTVIRVEWFDAAGKPLGSRVLSWDEDLEIKFSPKQAA